MKNNELFTIKPSLKQYYGRTVTKEMKFDETTEDGIVHQILDNLVLKTIIDKEDEYEDKDKYLYYVACTRAQHELIIYNQKRI